MNLPIRISFVRNKYRTFVNNHGFTLVEMMVVTLVFVVVLIITGNALKTILTKGAVTLRSEESNIDGVVGLEILRHDLQQIGFGLFTDEGSAPTYAEATAAPYSTYNDSNAVPRPFVSDENVAVAGVLAGTDYLVVKGTSVARTETSQRWSYLTDTGLPKIWGRDDFTDTTDKAIVIEQKFDKAKNSMIRKLVQKSSSDYGVSYSSTGIFRDQAGNDLNVTGEYTPPTGKIFYLYGVDSAAPVFTLSAPFNRADFFVSQTPNPPGSCSPAAGVLYKATMDQGAGTFTKIPILDCVADMQVILGWNSSSDPEKSSEVQVYTNANGTTVFGGSNGLNFQSILGNAQDVRTRLKVVMVYLLAQDGRRDNDFVNTNNAMVVGDTTLGAALTKTVNLTTANLRNYRWKLHKIVVRPKNLY
jgi:prepilin-type N-terminal cleavage/methylation domain-containing protein